MSGTPGGAPEEMTSDELLRAIENPALQDERYQRLKEKMEEEAPGSFEMLQKAVGNRERRRAASAAATVRSRRETWWVLIVTAIITLVLLVAAVTLRYYAR